MIKRIIYLLFVIGLIPVAAIISIVLQIFFINESEYENSQFVAPNLPAKNSDRLKIDDKLDHLFVFMQISDIHISVNADSSRRDALKLFCTDVVDLIKPKVVVASGDLVNSRDSFSRQVEQEWIWYSEILNSTKVAEKTIWLDIRGNHDAFDVFSWNSSNNYYRIYSNHGKHSEKHYHYNVKDGTDLYTFIGVDSCINPGIKGPFNFVGVLDHHDIKHLTNLRDDAINNGTNFTIWFGHYPTSSISMPSCHNIKHIISGPYLCGHFHTVHGYIEQMYASHREGLLELEVGDFKDNRLFRVAAIDHGIFNFVDVKLNDYPIILITNPKDPKFNMPGYEPLHRIEQSTHIRVLIYSIGEISSVELKIDNEAYVNMESTASKNLYVLKWNPQTYKTGLHKITVKVKDKLENEREITQSFSLDNSKDAFTYGGRLFLRIPRRSFDACLYLVGLMVSLSPLIVGFYIRAVDKEKIIKEKAEHNLFYRWLFKFYLLSSMKKISLILVAIPIYIGFCPWYIGHVLTDRIGIGFAWGILVDGTVVPIALTYERALFMTALFHFSITCCIAHIIYCNYIKVHQGTIDKTIFDKYVHIRNFFYLFIVFYNFFTTYKFVNAYGVYTLIFGFVTLYLLIVYLVLFFYILNINSFPEETATTDSKDPKSESLLNSK